MKKIFTKLMLLAVAAAALVSCENKIDESTPVVELTQTVTLTAEKPVEVRTEMIEGVPYWSKGDQIGVYVVDGESYKNYAFKNDAEEATLTTSFTGETAVANTLFVYYPYTNFSNPVTEKGVKVEILANQEPTATSFDGRTDLMIAKPVQLDAEGKQLSDLEFARVAAIVKIVLKDKTGNLAGQHISSLTMTAATHLVGRVYLDVVNQEIFTGEGGGLYYGGAKSVNATYTEATQYEVNGTNATYVIVYPQTLKSGSTLSFEATTEGYAISKSIELGQDIVLESGKVTTLNVSLAAANVVKEETGLDLPFNDDFAWVTGTSESADISTALKGEYYASGVKAFSAGGAIKFGTGSVAGSITTVPLNLSEPFTVIVKAKKYGNDNAKIKAVVGETSQQITLTADYAYYGIEFEAATKKSSLTLEAVNTSDCRFYIDELQVVAGHDVVLPTVPPVLTVSKSEISVSHEAATETFTYSVANPVDGVNVAISDNAEWITTSVNGTTVTVTVAENTAEEARDGVITVTYTGAESKTVTVKQAAKPTEDGPTEVVDVLNLALTGMSGTTYDTWSGKTSNSTAVYAGNSAGGNSSIQLRSTNSNSGIVTTASGGKVAKVVVTWNSSTSAGRTLDIYGENTAYTAATDLYNTTNQGTKLGSIKCGTSTELVITGDYKFIGMRSNSSAMYIDKIEITWVSGNGGSTPEPATPVLSINPTTLSFDAAGGNKTVACTIENEVSGVNVTATESVDWLTTSVSGKTVTITATANTATTARTATVTIAYTGAESKTVTVAQAAAENTGGGTTGGTKTVKVTFSSLYSADTDVNGKVIAIDGNVNVQFNKASGSTNPKYYKNGTSVRFYAKGNFIVSSTKTITKITLTYGSSDGSNAITASPGTFTSPNWTGSASSVTFTQGGSSGNRRIAAIEVTYQE